MKANEEVKKIEMWG